METNMERTLILMKPDAVQRQLAGRILSRFENKGLKIVGLKMLQVTDDQARRMYAEHEGKDFYQPLMAFITAGPVVAVALEGLGAIAICRALMGPTFGPDAPAGTIRGDFGSSRRYNLVHGSDSPASAERELALFFGDDELVDYERIISEWIYAKTADGLL
jgi:nucleoside-diphosphate kinase